MPGVRSAEKLKEIKLDWSRVADFVTEVKTKGSFNRSLELYRSGIMAGPSSGLQHFLNFAKRNRRSRNFAHSGLIQIRHARVGASSAFPRLRGRGEVGPHTAKVPGLNGPTGPIRLRDADHSHRLVHSHARTRFAKTWVGSLCSE
jgi:hypothetical protein